MARLDVPMRALADKLLQTFGTDGEIVRKESGIYDSEAGKRPEQEFVTDVKGVFDEYRQYEINDSIHAGDRKFIIAAKGLEYDPKAGDTMKIQNVEYRIISATAAMSGTEAAIWTLQLRGSGA